MKKSSNSKVGNVAKIEITFDGVLKGSIYNAVLSSLGDSYIITDEGENYLSSVYLNSCKVV